MIVAVVVHPIDEASSPGAGGLWRWAVHVGYDWSDQESCLNAGAEESPQLAAMRGQAVAVAAAKVAERLGALEIDHERSTTFLAHDPCGEPWPLAVVEEL